jgi:hypothetical protein
MCAALPGGFVPFSPPPSSVASSTVASALPHPRKSPLKAGGVKESSLIRYVDQKILHIQRRFAKRDPSLGYQGRVREVDEEGRMIEEIGDPATVAQLAKSEEWYDVPGYSGFGEATKEVEEVVGVIWVSGTRTDAFLLFV